MDCKNARLLLEFVHPGSAELDAAEAEALHQHLAECPDCAAQAREERRADEHLGRAMRDVPVPAGLRERLLKRLTVERDRWYRRWIVRGVAAVAAVAALWVGYLVWFNQLPAVTTAEVRRIADSEKPVTRDRLVRAFTKEFGVAVNPPDRFNYNLLESYGLEVLEGRPVPCLLFYSGPDRATGAGAAFAHVFVLSDRQFDLEQTMRNIGAASSGIRYQIDVTFSHDKDAIYLVFYTGDSLKRFCKTDSQ
jgi:hypothetical protein